MEGSVHLEKNNRDREDQVFPSQRKQPALYPIATSGSRPLKPPKQISDIGVVVLESRGKCLLCRCLTERIKNGQKT